MSYSTNAELSERLELAWSLKGADGRTYRIPLDREGTVTIGRDLTSHVALLDAGVSRHHATLTLEGNELWVEDLHSQNGTFVNSRRVYRSRLEDGDTVTFGRMHLRVQKERCESTGEEDELAELAPGTDAALLRIARALPLGRSPAECLERGLARLAVAIRAELAIVMSWQGSKRSCRLEAAARGSDQAGRRVALERLRDGEELRGPALEALFATGAAACPAGLHLHATEPAPGPAVAAAHALAAPVLLEGDRVGLVYVERLERPGRKELELLTGFAWLVAPLLDAARRPAAALPSAVPPSPPPSRFEAPSVPRALGPVPLVEQQALPIAQDPARLLSLLEGQASRVRRDLSSSSRLLPAEAGRLRELTLAANAVRRLLGGEASRPSRTRLFELVSSAVSESAVSARDWQCAVGGDLELEVSRKVLRLVLDLLVLAFERFFGSRAPFCVQAAAPPVAGAPGTRRLELRFEAERADGDASAHDWNELDLSLVLARNLIERLLAGELAIDPQAGTLILRLPVTTAGPFEATAVL